MKHQKLIMRLVFVAALLAMTAQTAWATTITPSSPTQDADGYYLIGNAAELYGFAELVNNGNTSANAKLTADIVVNENVLDANGEANTGDFVQWTPIGNNDNSKTYSGTFDGQGHTISGLYVSGSGWYVGFIGEVSGSAVVRNLGIVDSYFSSSNNILGSIVGGVSYSSSVTLVNVYSTSTVKGDNWIGGLAVGDRGSVSVVNSYFAGKTSAGWNYGTHHDDLVSGSFNDFNSETLNIVNTFVVGTSQYGTSVTAGQLSDGTVAAALHYYQDALADGSMFGINDGKTTFSGSLEGVSVTTADITLNTFDGDATAYSSKYVVGITTPLPVNVVREGYTFLGWYDNANFEGDAVTQISSSETGNKEYWAKFVRSHSVSFVLNGGTIQKGEIDHYIEGEATTLPTMVFKDGASFEGWYTTEDFTGDRYYSIPATATEDMAFYAKWGAAKTTFYLIQDSPDPVNVLYEGENVVYLDKTTMAGYYVRDEYRNYWGGFSGSVNVPYTGGESTFGNGGRAFNVAQSGFYVFTLTDKGEGNWFVSVLRSLENCTVSDIPDQTYTGSEIEPEIVVTDGETTLTLGTDYTVSYSGNTNAGTATVTIAGMGNYSGTIEKTFTITKATPTVTAPTAIADLVYTGSAQALVTAGTTTFGSLLYSTNGENYFADIPKATNAGTYTVYYKVEGSDNWNAVDAQSVEVTIAAKETNLGAVTIVQDQNGTTATIDASLEATIEITSDIKVSQVALQRSFTENQPATVMLPFSLGDGQAVNGGSFYKFSGVTKDGDEWKALFTEVATLKANTPYLFMPSATGQMTFNLNGGTVTLNTTTTGDAGSTASYWEFRGTYAKVQWDGTASDPSDLSKTYGFAKGNGTTIAAGQFVHFAAGAWLKPMRCYLVYNGSTEGGTFQNARSMTRGAGSTEELPQTITVVLLSSSGETTGIGTLDTKTGDITLDGWYTMDGRKLEGKPTKKGLYINNGRKIVIK